MITVTDNTLADSIGVTQAIAAFDSLQTAEPIDAIDEVKARLAARGLLRTEPTVVVPRPATRRPAPAATPAPTAVFAVEPAEPPAPEVEIWDVHSESVAMIAVTCPRCREQRPSPADVTRFTCDSCAMSWRWATCAGCHHLGLVPERSESWQCRGCGNYTRSWWRTPEMQREAAGVVARRREVAAEAERAKLRAGARRRRRFIAAGALVAAAMLAAFVGTVRSSEPSAAEATAATCARFERLRANLANGTSTPADVRTELRELQSEAVTAAPEVQSAVADLAGAGRPGQSAFLVASTKLADACG